MKGFLGKDSLVFVPVPKVCIVIRGWEVQKGILSLPVRVERVGKGQQSAVVREPRLGPREVPWLRVSPKLPPARIFPSWQHSRAVEGPWEVLGSGCPCFGSAAAVVTCSNPALFVGNTQPEQQQSFSLLGFSSLGSAGPRLESRCGCRFFL